MTCGPAAPGNEWHYLDILTLDKLRAINPHLRPMVYDHEADALYVYAGGPIEPGAAVTQEQVAPGVIVDRDVHGTTLGVEMLMFDESPEDRDRRIERALASSEVTITPAQVSFLRGLRHPR